MRKKLKEKLLDMMLVELETKHNPTLSEILEQMFRREATRDTIFIQLFIAYQLSRHKPIRLGDYMKAESGEIDDQVFKGLCDAFVAFSEAHITAKPIGRSTTGSPKILVDNLLAVVVQMEVKEKLGQIFTDDELEELRREASERAIEFPDAYIRAFIRGRL